MPPKILTPGTRFYIDHGAEPINRRVYKVLPGSVTSDTGTGLQGEKDTGDKKQSRKRPDLIPVEAIGEDILMHFKWEEIEKNQRLKIVPQGQCPYCTDQMNSCNASK